MIDFAPLADVTAERTRPQTRRELFMAGLAMAVAELRAAGKLPTLNTDDARPEEQPETPVQP